MGDDNKGGTAGADLERARSLFTAVAESSYRAEKASNDAAFERMRRKSLQLGVGLGFFAPDCLYHECGSDLRIGQILCKSPGYDIMLSEDDSLTVIPSPH